MPKDTIERFTKIENRGLDSSPLGLEEELRRSMQRVDAPPNFVDSVMARLDKHRRRRWFWSPSEHTRRFPQPFAAVLAAMLVCAVLLGTGYESHRRSRQAQAEQAAQQFALALRVTQGALLHAEQRFAGHAAARQQRLRRG